MKKKVLLLIFGNLNAEPRILNQFKALKEDYNLYSCGTRPNRQENVPFFDVKKILRHHTFHYSYPLPLRKLFTAFFVLQKKLIAFSRKKKFSDPFEFRYWQHVNFKELDKLRNEKFDAIIVHDIGMLPIGAYLCQENTRLIFDAHEFFLDQADSAEWRAQNVEYRKYLFKTYEKKMAVMFTVNSTIDQKLKSILGANSLVVTNAKEYRSLSPSQTKPDQIHIVHHGICAIKRNLEDIVAIMDFLDKRFVLHLYLMPSDPGVMENIVAHARENPRIIIHPPIETERIPEELNKYDLGIFLLKNDNYNYYNSLPNKFFEFVQARLMVVINPLPEMAALVKEYNLGIVNENFSVQELAARLNALSTEEIMRYKNNSNQAAYALRAENEWTKMRETMHNLLS